MNQNNAVDQSSPFAELCCLVVEDNSYALDIMHIFLKRQGFVVDDAANGQIALEKYQANPHRYHIIFMDLQMPVMSGYEATRKIRESGQPGCTTIPIVAMSGDPLNDLQELGFSQYLTKPFEMRDVLTLLHAILPN